MYMYMYTHTHSLSLSLSLSLSQHLREASDSLEGSIRGAHLDVEQGRGVV